MAIFLYRQIIIRGITTPSICSTCRVSYAYGLSIRRFCFQTKNHLTMSFFKDNNFDRSSAMAKYSTSATDPTADQAKKPDDSTPDVSKRSMFKKAIKDYGATVVVFHVALSLTSLGLVYLLVSSGLDMVAILEKFGVGQSILESKITQGASTFVIAYAVHKVFAPVRITITLSATPFIVRYLRNIGLLKKPMN